MEYLDTLVRGSVAGCVNQGPESAMRRHVGRRSVRLYAPGTFLGPGGAAMGDVGSFFRRRMRRGRLAVCCGQGTSPAGYLLRHCSCSLDPSREEANTTTLPV